jgi:hypothetical protein
MHPWQAPAALVHAQLLNRLAVAIEQNGFGGEEVVLDFVVCGESEAGGREQ